MWRTSVVTASDRIFPGLAYHDRKKEFYDIAAFLAEFIFSLFLSTIERKKRKEVQVQLKRTDQVLISTNKLSLISELNTFNSNETRNQIQSNLPLQMALYFNVWAYPVWFFVILVNLDAKYYYLTDVYKFITVAVFIVISILEGVRLYMGYLGNLAEKIPELASFWLISTLIHFPLEMFLLFDSKTKPHLSETITNGIMAFLLVVEIITATVALKKSADHHAKRFYVAQLYGIDDSRH